MKSSSFFSRHFKAMLVILLLSNFSAFAQKTTIWIVNHAEKDKNSEGLSDTGKMRAADLMKTLKHEGVEVIYTTNKKESIQTADPLAAKAKILPRIYTDSIKKFAAILTQNFIGKKILVVANYNTIISLLNYLGAESPFDALDKDDYDQLFTVTIKPSGDVSCAVQYFSRSHHVNAIPQSYILDNFSPGLPGK